jgi:acetoin:2,6-dichlorophenolindophenol oxidoreductase subunit alpha
LINRYHSPLAEKKSELGELTDPRSARYLADCVTDGFDKAELLRYLESMRLIRRVEEQIGDWVTARVARCPCHLGIGQEAIAVGIAAALLPTDRLFGNHRSHAHFLAVGGSPDELLAEVLGRATGCSRGMGGSMHLIDRQRGFHGSVPIVGATIPIALGAALAARMDGTGAVAVAYFGDGAAEEGVLHETLNFAAVHELPMLFVCENNQYSSHLDIALRQPSDRVCRYAEAHRIDAHVFDGNDVTGVTTLARRVVGDMRRNGRPAFLEGVTYRWRGHVGPNEDIDVGVRRSTDDLVAWKARDPVARLERALVTKAIAQKTEIEAVSQRVLARVDGAARAALAAPWPPESALLGSVFAETRP